MKIIVAGGGIGGFSAALALTRAGFAVEIIEQASAFGEVGAGIQLSPNAMKGLDYLDVATAVEAKASRPEALELRIGQTGARVFSIPAGEAALRRYGAPYLHTHRADLLDILIAAAERAGVKMSLGRRVVRFAHVANAVDVGLDTGEVLRGDLLVGADGLGSQVRRQMHGAQHPRFTGSVAWRGLAPADVAPDLPQAAVVWAGPGQHAVTYRVRNNTLINFVGVIEQPGIRADDWQEEGWAHSGDPAELMTAFAGWFGPLPQIIAQLGEVKRWALLDREPLSRWWDQRVVLLGDACHPMPPFQAQGAAMAIEDAVVLARRLAEFRDEPEKALQAYQEDRQGRTARVLASARANMAIFHRSSAVSKLVTYGPMRLAAGLVPALIRSRQDWLYGYDAARG